MSALREAARKALEALEFLWGGEPMGTLERDAISALRAALAEPEQEPVGWQSRLTESVDEGPGIWIFRDGATADFLRGKPGYEVRPVYAHQPGHIVVTKNDAGQIIAVTRQDSDGRVLEVIAESAQAVPDGWQLVPNEPTIEMDSAFERAHHRADFRVESYKAMLAAAPKPPASTPSDGEAA